MYLIALGAVLLLGLALTSRATPAPGPPAAAVNQAVTIALTHETSRRRLEAFAAALSPSYPSLATALSTRAAALPPGS